MEIVSRSVDWGAVADTACRWGLERPVHYALALAACLLILLGLRWPVLLAYGILFTMSLDYLGRLGWGPLTANNLLKANYSFHNLAHHSEIIPIIPEFKHRIKLFDTDKLPYVIEEGERAAEAQLPFIKSLLGK